MGFTKIITGVIKIKKVLPIFILAVLLIAPIASAELDVGVSYEFYNDSESAVFRADISPLDLPMVAEIKPSLSGQTVVLDEVGFGVKYPEPFDLTNAYVIGKSGLVFPDENQVGFNFGALELGVGYAQEVGILKMRGEFFVEDFMDSENRKYKGVLTIQYPF